MLVLTRFRDEQILIGDDITVTILSIHGDRVRLGVDAPKTIRVDRKEIRVKIDEARKQGDGRDGQ